jgi:CRP/FNR family transcriptional regulator, cyclic AMP receptor protein
LIPAELIQEYGGQQVLLAKDEVLFYEEEEARFYFQVFSGQIKMVHYSSEGQEFIQGFFEAGQSFGEPPLFANFRYPSDAVATEDAVVLRLGKDSFFRLLKDHFEIHLKFNEIFSRRLKYKSLLLREISSYAPEHRILTLISYFKEKSGQPTQEPYVVPYTRQQIADMTGLRVETVIRAVSKLKQEGKLKVIRHKIEVG